MSKIICELCGTAYPDTAECCPTCGTAKPEAAEFSPPVQEEAAPRRSYTPTKGGRFSDTNVRKRLKNKGIAPVPAKAPRQQAPKQERPAAEPRQSRPNREPKQQEKNSGSNKGLMITAIILILAILGMIVYIYVTFFMPKPSPEQPGNEQSNQQHQQLPQQTQGTTAEPDLSCDSLILSEDSIILDQAGSSWLLNVIPEPANTVDAITYVSADPNVATVSADGKVTAVASGETVITITCGVVKVECKVVCDIAPPTTVPETTVPETTVATVEFKLNREDITFDGKGQSWLLYKGEIPLTSITWTSSNPEVATVRNGTVKAVGPGKTTVYAEYNGQKVSCIIRCDF